MLKLIEGVWRVCVAFSRFACSAWLGVSQPHRKTLCSVWKAERKQYSTAFALGRLGQGTRHRQCIHIIVICWLTLLS